MEQTLHSFLRAIPKAENHYHIDAISPALMWRFAQRNRISTPFHSLEETEAFYEFHTLGEFLNVMMQGILVVRQEEDFYDMVLDCAEDMVRQNIRYREAMFSYTACFGRQGVALETMVRGFSLGLREAKARYDVDLCFIADLDRTAPAEDNCAFLRALEPFRAELPIAAVGLDMQEAGYPAHLQQPAFRLAKELGYFTTAHAGENVGAESVADALIALGVDRIDHGIRAVEDPALLQTLRERDILLTVCPGSNLCLRIYPGWEQYPLDRLLAANVPVSINSDDPPCFRMDLTQNLIRTCERYGLSLQAAAALVRNAFAYSFSGRAHLPDFDRWVQANIRR